MHDFCQACLKHKESKLHAQDDVQPNIAQHKDHTKQHDDVQHNIAEHSEL